MTDDEQRMQGFQRRRERAGRARDAVQALIEADLARLFDSGGLNVARAAEIYHVSRPTIYLWLKRAGRNSRGPDDPDDL